MQADVRIGISDARIGFAGPAVILNTMCEANQVRYDNECPADFQSTSYLLEQGQVDFIIDTIAGEDKTVLQKCVEDKVAQVANLLLNRNRGGAKGMQRGPRGGPEGAQRGPMGAEAAQMGLWVAEGAQRLPRMSPGGGPEGGPEGSSRASASCCSSRTPPV